MDGTTICTRLLGAAYLYPHVVPDPFSLSVALRATDEFIVVANSALWDVITPEDAVEEIYEIGSPVVAAKHLQDLAQVRWSRSVTLLRSLSLSCANSTVHRRATYPGPRLTQPSILSWSVNEYRLRLGRFKGLISGRYMRRCLVRAM